MARKAVSEDIFSVAGQAHVADWTDVALGALLITRLLGGGGRLGDG